jgi:LysR family hydrogen peroxide-inducible transcriptional activator
MVDLNNGITIMTELSLAEFSVKQLDKVRYFKSPVPTREISIVTHRNYLKRQLIATLKKEIMEFIPKQMKSQKKREVIDIF